MGNMRRFLGAATENLFFARTYGNGRSLVQKNVFEVFPLGGGVASITLANLDRPWCAYGEPWFHTVASYASDIVSLCLLTKAIRPRVIFEIGTFRGYTALHFALNSDPQATVHSLDLPREGPFSPALTTTVTDGHISSTGRGVRQYVFEGYEAAHKIRCLYGDSATFDFTPFKNSVDLFFIDGAHSYDYVRSDTLKALECVVPGGAIVWHDFGRVGENGVTRWLTEFAQGREVYCVPGSSVAFMKA
jgi:hypothetical protein